MHYTIEIIERVDGRWRWHLIAPNGHSMTGGFEGDGFPSPSAALRSLQDTAKVFMKFGEEISTWSAGGESFPSGDLMKIDGEARKAGLILRVIRQDGEG